MKPNKNYKDSVFTKLFGHDEKIILELYNAIFNANCGEDTKIEITTLDEALFMDWINDISFVIDGKLVVLIEHQSTINNNMPLRMLIYITKIYEKIRDTRSLYKKKATALPRPEFVVLYNGKEEYPDRKELKLSDMFEKYGEENPVNLELVVQIYNINKGRNPEFAARSTTLDQYEIFVAKVHENEKTMPKKEAIIKAVKDCSDNGILKEFLRKHSAEVVNMLLREFTMKEAQEVWKEEGMEEKQIEIARNMKVKGYDLHAIAEITGLTFDEVLNA